MRSNQIKAILLVFVMMVSFVFSNNAVFAADEDVEFSVEANSGRPINAREDFTLSLTIKNNNSDKQITNIKVIFGKSKAFIPSGGQVQSFDGTIDAGKSDSDNFEMFYSGDPDTDLQITIEYEYVEDGTEDDSGRTTGRTINIDNAIPDDTSGGSGGTGGGGGSSVDKADFKPILEISSGAIPEGKAGRTITIPLTISNIAKYEAREIRITPTLPENVFIIDQMTVYEVIDKIPAGKSSGIDFKFMIDENAKAGTYKVPLEIKYKNVYGVDFSDSKDIYIKIINENLPPPAGGQGSQNKPCNNRTRRILYADL